MASSPEPVWVVLTQAADRLTELAGKASPGPWQASGIGDFGWTVHGPDGSPETADSEQGRADADWIAAMSPVVAAPLAEWLRQTARYARYELGGARSLEAGERFQAEKYAGAIAFSRAVLGVDRD